MPQRRHYQWRRHGCTWRVNRGAGIYWLVVTVSRHLYQISRRPASRRPQLSEEADTIKQLLAPLPAINGEQPDFCSASLTDATSIIRELAAVGRATVKMGLVDSFFGNISYTSHDTLYISQTSARLDELEHQIDPIPHDNSSTAGITASSELPAHRAIVAATGCRAVLHGHPRYRWL